MNSILKICVLGVKKILFRQMRFMLGWGPKSKLDNGLQVQPKGYQWNFWEIRLIFCLGPKLGLARIMGWSKMFPTADTTSMDPGLSKGMELPLATPMIHHTHDDTTTKLRPP